MPDLIDPKQMTIDLRGKWQRSYGTAPCPCCQPERRRDQNALSITEAGGRLLLNCHKLGCAFTDILAAAGYMPGHFEIDREAVERSRREQAREDAKTLAQAKSLWEYADQIEGSRGASYLRGRGITCPLPDSLRWASDVFHKPSGRYCAAMIANVVNLQGETVGVHRTFFTKQGERLDRATGTTSHKMMMGRIGGAAVRLFDADSATEGPAPLVVGEGIETSLSLMCGLLSEPVSVWSALSTSGMAGLHLPHEPGRLIIATDRGQAGESAGNRLAQRAHGLGWQVSLLPVPDEYPDASDWNDVLRMQGATV